MFLFFSNRFGRVGSLAFSMLGTLLLQRRQELVQWPVRQRMASPPLKSVAERRPFKR